MTGLLSRKLVGNLLFCGCALVMFGCSSSQQDSANEVKIVGGTSVSQDDPIVRSTVALLIKVSAGTALCTGSLIDARHVLTAGHCLANSPQKVSLQFGLSIKSSQPSSVGMDSYLVNQNYGAEGGSVPPSDISLVTLSQDAPSEYAPVPMLAKDDQMAIGETVTLAGYGQTDVNDHNATHLLRKVNVQLVKAVSDKAEIEVGGNPGHGACHGDSGGPAFVTRDGQLYLVGVTSRDSFHDGRCEHNTIYTDVRYYQDWITTAENQ